jgi:hypothetical protein
MTRIDLREASMVCDVRCSAPAATARPAVCRIAWRHKRGRPGPLLAAETARMARMVSAISPWIHKVPRL